MRVSPWSHSQSFSSVTRYVSLSSLLGRAGLRGRAFLREPLSLESGSHCHEPYSRSPCWSCSSSGIARNLARIWAGTERRVSFGRGRKAGNQPQSCGKISVVLLVAALVVLVAAWPLPAAGLYRQMQPSARDHRRPLEPARDRSHRDRPTASRSRRLRQGRKPARGDLSAIRSIGDLRRQALTRSSRWSREVRARRPPGRPGHLRRSVHRARAPARRRAPRRARLVGSVRSRRKSHGISAPGRLLSRRSGGLARRPAPVRHQLGPGRGRPEEADAGPRDVRARPRRRVRAASRRRVEFDRQRRSGAPGSLGLGTMRRRAPGQDQSDVAFDLSTPDSPRLVGRTRPSTAEVPYVSHSPDSDWIMMPVASPSEAIAIASPLRRRDGFRDSRGRQPIPRPDYVVCTRHRDSVVELMQNSPLYPLGRLPLTGPLNMGRTRPTGLAYSPERGLLAVSTRSGSIHCSSWPGAANDPPHRRRTDRQRATRLASRVRSCQSSFLTIIRRFRRARLLPQPLHFSICRRLGTASPSPGRMKRREFLPPPNWPRQPSRVMLNPGVPKKAATSPGGRQNRAFTSCMRSPLHVQEKGNSHAARTYGSVHAASSTNSTNFEGSSCPECGDTLHVRAFARSAKDTCF